MKKHLLLSTPIMLAVATQGVAQTRSISGRITDRATGDGLPGVTVLIKGTSNGVSTNSDGSFTLSAPNGDATLLISSVGFVSQEVAVSGGQSTVNLSLSADAKALSEVIVTGYGQQQERRDVIGAISAIKSSEFKDQPIIGVDQALQGRAAGVQVIQNSGTPGSGIAVRVRGAASIGASNEPLYVVDGLPINTGSYSQLGTGNQQTNALADINPNDIESIEVLKDAASAAIYGSRASNGVVLITTKRGKIGKPTVDLEYYTGAQSIWKKPDVLTGQEQTQLFLEATNNRYPAATNGTVSALGVTFRSTADLAGYLYGPSGYLGTSNGLYVYTNTTNLRPLTQFQDPTTSPNTRWTDEVIRTAPISNYGVTFSGGTDASRYRVALNYFDQDGIIIGSGFKRGSVRVSMDNKLSSKIKMGVSMGLNQSINNRIINDNSIYGVLTSARLTSSDLPIYNPDGTYAKYGSIENPVAAAKEPFIKSVSNRLIASQYTEFEFIKNLKYRASFGLDYVYFRDDRFISTLLNGGVGVRGEATVATSQNPNYNHISSFNFNKTLGDHTISALLVGEYQRDTYSDTYAQATNFPSNTIRELAAGAQKTAATTSSTVNALFGALGKIDYSFKGRYLLGASLRRDQSSRFGKNNQVGYFPAVSAGWRVLDEAFLKDQTAVTELKLRGSYGETGNASINNFASRGLISPGANYLDQGGLVLSQLENRNLKWERTRTTNVGIDLGFIKNRVYLSVDAYKRKTDDLLLTQPINNITGFGGYASNVGNIENKGIEFALNTINVESEGTGFGWQTNFNLSLNRNKVTRLADSDINPLGQASGFASRLIVGQPLGAFYGYRVESLFQTQDEINALNSAAVTKYGAGAVYQSSLTRAGDIKFKDLNGDGRITSADQEIIGNAQPKFYGGITNTFRFMNFDLSAFVQYNVGNKIYNSTRSFTEGMSNVYGQDATVRNRWTPNNTNTDIPRAVYGDPNNNARTSDRFLEDGSYARLKTLTLGYTLPTAIGSRFHLRTVRIYAQAQNLATFTNYSGLDPEVSTFSGSNTSGGTDFFTYPQARTITGGINIGF